MTEDSRLKIIYCKSSWLSAAVHVDDTPVIDGFHDIRYYLEIIYFAQPYRRDHQQNEKCCEIKCDPAITFPNSYSAGNEIVQEKVLNLVAGGT